MPSERGKLDIMNKFCIQKPRGEPLLTPVV